MYIYIHICRTDGGTGGRSDIAESVPLFAPLNARLNSCSQHTYNISTYLVTYTFVHVYICIHTYIHLHILCDIYIYNIHIYIWGYQTQKHVTCVHNNYFSGAGVRKPSSVQQLLGNHCKSK